MASVLKRQMGATTQVALSSSQEATNDYDPYIFDEDDDDNDKDPTFIPTDLDESDDDGNSMDTSDDSEESDSSHNRQSNQVPDNNLAANVSSQMKANNNELFSDIDSVGDDFARKSVPMSVPYVESQGKFVMPRYGKKKTFCRICSMEVTNFERHLERNHKDRKEVLEMLSKPKKTQARKQIIAQLRNEGHFEEYLRGRTRPIYHTKSKSKDKRYYPCSACKGIYLKEYLYRHYKRCRIAKISENSHRVKHLSASQTIIACALDKNDTIAKMRVKTDVFEIMRADEISMVAKTDSLIYTYGENYLKKHRRKQMAVVCSNKMRELARLLIEVRKITNDQNLKLSDIINPSAFDKVVECAKRVGGYDSDKKVYRAPSLAAHLGTSLRQVSELLMSLITRGKWICTDSEATLKATKRFKELVVTQWTTEISSLAFKDLAEKKWNKPQILPLTQDVLKFKNHVTQVGNIAVASLAVDPNNKKEYRNLVNAALALTILYNRKRIGDVQFTKLDTYLRNFSSSNQEECMNSLSPSEKVLTKHYKRVVTGGKGSRAVVILFPQHLQDLMNVLIDIRFKTTLVPESNQFLFALPGSDRWVRGDVVIRKFSQKCGIEHPEHISSNKLRKQIATVMQILNLNPDESDQFAQFMGHTAKTHDEFYKLPQDVYQTAKVSKLLILMDKGQGQEHQGKSLSEIDINPAVDVVESENSENDEPPGNDIDAETSNFMPEIANPSPTKKLSHRTPKQSGRSPWTPEQIKVVKDHFKRHIQLKKAPKKVECEELITKYQGLLGNKDWVRVKTYVYNSYRQK